MKKLFVVTAMYPDGTEVAHNVSLQCSESEAKSFAEQGKKDNPDMYNWLIKPVETNNN